MLVIDLDLDHLSPFRFKHVVEKVGTGQVRHLVDDCPQPELQNDLLDVPIEEQCQHNLLRGDDDAEETAVKTVVLHQDLDLGNVYHAKLAYHEVQQKYQGRLYQEYGLLLAQASE